MTWKDLSELHIASVDSGDDTLFDAVIKGKIAEAIWKIDQRRDAATSATLLGEGADVAARNDLMKALGVERFVDMEDPKPPAFLVRNVLEVGHPSYIYGGRC